MVGPTTATELFFHDATPADARWATQRLRPQAYRVMQETTPLTAWPDVECRSIVCRERPGDQPGLGPRLPPVIGSGPRPSRSTARIHPS